MTDLTPVAPWRRLQLPIVIAALACLRPFYNSVDVFSLRSQISVTPVGAPAGSYLPRYEHPTSDAVGQRCSCSARQQIAKIEALAQNCGAPLHDNRPAENWSSVNEGVKFATFAARVSIDGQVLQKAVIIFSATKLS